MHQLNPIIGDVLGNTDRIIASVQTIDADLIVTPEMSICGYPPRDLLHCTGFVQACEEAVLRIASHSQGKTVLVGHPARDASTGRVRNRVSVLQDGDVIATCDKQLLPSYDVFDETRYFEPGVASCTIDVCGTTVGITICEDFWRGTDANAAPSYDINPIEEVLQSGCTVIVSPSASPFVVGKRETHVQYALDLAAEHNITIVVCNQVGGNDDVVFDGGSFVVSSEGMLGELPTFETGSIVVDTTCTAGTGVTQPSQDEECFKALVLGTRDYFAKTGHSHAILGLSGGIDSALVATLAVAALGKEAVTGVLMPSRFSSLGSIEDAEQLAASLGMNTTTLPIEHMHGAFERTFNEGCLEATGVAGENVQARIRGVLLMACSNTQGSLLLATGNKSELAVGYSTLYGVMVGAVSVICDIYKTDVWSMSKWINEHYRDCGFDAPPIPEASITKPPSAELRPDQLDQDSLPEYAVLDSILRLHIDFDLGIDDVEDELGLDLQLITDIIRMVDFAQYKRHQAATILKTSPRAFGSGRRMPIVMKRAWTTTRETT